MPGTDLDRITSAPRTPFNRSASSGTVMSCSTSSAESPSASVWISAYGGLNSGRTSTGAPRSWTMATTTSPSASPNISSAKRTLNRITAGITEDRLGERPPASFAGDTALGGLLSIATYSTTEHGIRTRAQGNSSLGVAEIPSYGEPGTPARSFPSTHPRPGPRSREAPAGGLRSSRAAVAPAGAGVRPRLSRHRDEPPAVAPGMKRQLQDSERMVLGDLAT